MHLMRLFLLGMMLVLCGSVATAFRYDGTRDSGRQMAAAGSRFLVLLSAEQKAKALLDYGAPSRVDWHFIPKNDRKGLQIRDMSTEQRAAAAALLKTALSEAGLEKANRIMAMEELLKELQKGNKNAPIRDTERYYFTFFGPPAETGRWGLSVEGHHLSLNFVVDNGLVISATPTALAANPANIQSAVLPQFPVGTRILRSEEELAFQLLNLLTEEQKKVAIVSSKPLTEVRNAGQPQPPNEPAVGISASSLSVDQQELLKKLIVVYAGNLPKDVAASQWQEIETAGFDKIHFAWFGAEKPGVGHYYRVQGPTFLIEFVNTQPDSAGNPANHIHCLWRDMRGDFALPIEARP